MFKILNEYRNNLDVVCGKPNCPMGGRVMKFIEYEEHIQACLRKPIDCPLGCGFQFVTLDEAR